MGTIPEGRGHPTLQFIPSEEETNIYTFILACGASREKQFDDVWHLKVHKEDFKVDFEKVDYTNVDNLFTARNGQASVYDKDNKELLMLGGQDSVNNIQFNDLFSLNQANEMKKVEFDLSEGMPYPRVRNSHTLVRDHQNQKIY